MWWIVLIGAAWGLLPVTRLTRTAWLALALFGAFVAWTALAATWSLSSERSLQELSRVACYFGLLLLGISIHRERDRAVQHTVHAVATAVVAVACLALASRLRPDLFPAAHQTASYLPGTEGRLGWPLNYWNALAALLALGLPLLLSIATSARRLWAQSAAAAAIPVVTLCCYLTFSRGGAVAAGAGLLAFFLFSPDRVEKLVHGARHGRGQCRAGLGRRPPRGDRAGPDERRRPTPGRHLAGGGAPGLRRRGPGPGRRRTRRPPRHAAALAHVHAGPRADACRVRGRPVPRRGAARRGSRAPLTRLAGLQAPERGGASAGLDRALRQRQRQRPLRLLEGCGRRDRRAPAQRLGRRHLPAAVDPAGPVLQLRAERALAVPGDARGDRHRRARSAGGVPAGGAGGGGQAVHPGALRGEGARRRAHAAR